MLKRGVADVTSDMAFECLFISRDPSLFSVFARVLRDFSISMDVCLSAVKALDIVVKGHTELVLIDWENEDSPEFMHGIWKGGKWRPPTVVAISSSDTPIPGAHVVVKRPVTPASGVKCMKAAYSMMLLDYRRHARHALTVPLIATCEDGRPVSVTITDIGHGGVGLSTTRDLVVGDVLSFRLLLPGAPRDILVCARILWTREYVRAGCEFQRLPPVDLMILDDWLLAKGQVKKPLIEA